MTRIPAAQTARGLASCARAVIAGALAAIVCAPVSVSAAAAPSLRIASVAVTDGSNARLAVVVPPLLAGRDVPASAFHVTQAGRSLPVRVRRVADAGFDVYLLIDTTVAAATLAAVQSAAADLLRNLPPGVRTATADAGLLSVPPVQPGTTAALRDLAAARPLSTTFLREALSTIISRPTIDRRRVVVLLTDCGEQDLGDLNPVENALADGDQQLDVVAAGAGCPAQLSSLATGSGGLAVRDTPVDRLDQAVDTMLFDLLGQYRLSVPWSPDGAPLTVAVDYAGVRSAAVVPSSATSASSLAAEQLRQPDRDSPTLLAILAVIAALILASQAVIPALAGRRGRPHGRSAEKPRQAAGPSRTHHAASPGGTHSRHRRLGPP